MTRVPQLARVPMGTLDFLRAAEEAVSGLTELTGLCTWMVTRRVGDDSVVLAVEDDVYGLTPGASLRAFPALVRLRTADACPLVLPRIGLGDGDQVVDLRDGAVGAQVSLPLDIGQERAFGMVHGVDPDPHPNPAALHELQPTLELLAYLLGTVLVLDLDRSRLQRKIDVAEDAAHNDDLTGLGNRRAFERAVRKEQARCERFGHLAGVVVVDLDELKEINDRDGHAAGDDVLRRTSAALRASVREADQAFRVGGDEFALLLPEVSDADLESLCRRLEQALADAGVAASLGGAIRTSGGDLRDVVARADAAMYAVKATHRISR